MIVGFTWIWALDGWIVAVAMLCAVASALLGNFLVLRRMSMLGDAITHAVLPGLAVAFFISHSRSSLPMFLGAVIVGIAADAVFVAAPAAEVLPEAVAQPEIGGAAEADGGLADCACKFKVGRCAVGPTGRDHLPVEFLAGFHLSL